MGETPVLTGSQETGEVLVLPGKEVSMKKSALLYLSIVLIAVGIGGLIILQFLPLGRLQGSGSRTGSQTVSWGERIYFTGIGRNGGICYRSGPPWLRMRGGSCANCHGADGKGGLPLMMSDIEAPDITYDALTEKDHNEHGEEEHPPYNNRLIKRAITEGLDPAGEQLDQAMPRWDMSNRDLNDLIDFLKTL
jgi:hypothetical protein